MKRNRGFLILINILIIIATAYSQDFKLDVEGNSRVQGKLEIYSPKDSTSIYVGMAVGDSTIGTERTNTMIGSFAGEMNKTGIGNSYFGYKSGSQNQDATRNSFFGTTAGIVNLGSANNFFGHECGLANTSGSFNSFFGKSAGALNLSGSNNSFYGNLAGFEVTTGNQNTIIGSLSNPSDSDAVNQIVIGYNANGQGDNLAVIGNSSILRVYMNEDGTALVVSGSDRRMKRNISDSNLGLQFIKALRPVTYLWKDRKDFPKSFIKNESIEELNESHNNHSIQHGLIAQEVKKALDDFQIEWQGWDENPDNGKQGLNYAALTVPLIKAIQELSDKIDDQDREILNIKKDYEQLLLTLSLLAQEKYENDR